MKKIYLSLLISVPLFLFLTRPAFASIVNPDLLETQAANQAITTSGQVSDVPHGFRMFIINLWALIGLMGDPRVFTADASLQQQYYRNSAMGQVTNGIVYLYSVPPASTSQFVAYYVNKLNPVQPAYAQGIGFSGLSPLLGLWRAFRNIAYGFLILVMVVIGFMVLFRMKIDPRTVISVQNAIPRVIVTLILITFSYAIVGLMIDLMYLLIFLTISTLKSGLPTYFDNFGEAIAQYTGGSFATLAGSVFVTGSAAVDDIINVLFGSQLTLTAIGATIGAVIGAATAGVTTPFGFVLGAAGANALMYVLVWVALLFAIVRIFILLITSYVQVILALIFGPIQLMFGAIPNNDAFGNWMKGLISSLAVFPVVSMMLLLAMILSNIGALPNLWTPPGLGGGSVQTGISGIIGLAMLFIIPNIADSIKEALKAKSPIPIGGSTLISPLVSPISTGWNLFYQWSIISGHGRPQKPIIPGAKESQGQEAK